MSRAAAACANGESSGLPWGLWARQVLAVLRLEVRKTFLGKRSLPLYLLALLPVIPFALKALFGFPEEDASRIARSVALYANIFQALILRMCLFFGCVVVFTGLVRGEILDRSLHYYFLAPVRREVLVVGKYLSGLLATVVVFSAATALTMLLSYAPYGKSLALEHLFRGPGLTHLFWYLAVTALACLGYGAVFLLIGLLFKNPIVPAVAILGWESINFLLPPVLKKISVVHYLQSLCPVPISEGPFALVADPSPVWVAVPGLLALTAVLLAIAARRIRRLEIMYGAE